MSIIPAADFFLPDRFVARYTNGCKDTIYTHIAIVQRALVVILRNDVSSRLSIFMLTISERREPDLGELG